MHYRRWLLVLTLMSFRTYSGLFFAFMEASVCGSPADSPFFNRWTEVQSSKKEDEQCKGSQDDAMH